MAAPPAWRSPDLPIRVGISSCLLGEEVRYERVRAAARGRAPGYILKRASPSCGMERVKVHASDGPPARTGTGLFARALTAALPLLPVEEEGRLNEAHRRDNFITRVFAYPLRRAAGVPAAVVAFAPRTST